MSATVSLRTQTLGDLAVLSGDLRLRQWGPALAFVECALPSAPATGEAATLVVRREDGSEDTFAMAVRRAGNIPGSESLFVSLVGGAGKLLAELPPVDHVAGSTPVSAGLVLRRIADDAGEVLADGVEEALDARTLPRWHRAAGTPAWQALDLLADELGYVWRVLRSGRLWMGAETWPDAATVPTYITQDPDDGATVYAPDGAPITVGQTLGGVQVVEAAYGIAPGRLRLTVRGSVAGDAPRAIDRDLYARTWPATVVAQRSDGTLDVRCDDARIGELLAVPLRCGIPGASIVYQNPGGERVRLAFEGASPAGAYALPAHDQADPSAVAGVARVGDQVNVGSLQVVAPPGGGPCTITYTDARGNTGAGPSVTLGGVIVSGSPEVQIRWP